MVVAALELTTTVIPILVAVISSGFLFGLVKLIPERKSILIAASENAVRVVNEAVISLQKELTDARLEISRLEVELISGRSERGKLETELIAVRNKVIRLEAELDIYTRIVGANTAQFAQERALEKITGERKIEADVTIMNPQQGADDPAR